MGLGTNKYLQARDRNAGEGLRTLIRILTNHPGQEESTTWKASTTHVPFKGNSLRCVLSVVLELFRKRRSHDCIVLGAAKSNTVFCLLQTLLSFGKKPCILIDCLWYRSSGRFTSLMRIIKMWFVDKSVDRYIVWARREIEAYSEEFRLPRSKFLFVPYHTTLPLNSRPVKDDGYLFSGGNFARDYQTLIEAVRGLPVKLLIACTRRELFDGIDIPSNVEVQGLSHDEFMNKMAGCKINIVSLTPGLLHSGGQQTFLNSMLLGKPTIVNDPDGAGDYIEHGKTGLLAEPGSVSALREAIQFLLDNPDHAVEMGHAAHVTARSFSTEDHFRMLVGIAEKLMSEK